MYVRPIQPETHWLPNYQQFLDAMHDNWDLHFTIIGHKSAHYIISELYAVVFSSAFYSIVWQMAADALAILAVVIHSVSPRPLPLPPGESVQHPHNTKKDSSTNTYVCVCSSFLQTEGYI